MHYRRGSGRRSRCKGGNLRRAPRAAGRSGSADDRDPCHRSRQERGIRVAGRLHATRRSAGGPEERTARRARQRPPRRRTARAAEAHGRRARAPRVSGGHDSDGGGAHAIGHGHAESREGPRAVHHDRRRFVTRRHPCAFARYPARLRDRPGGPRSAERHAGDRRRHEGHASLESVDRGHRPHSPAPAGAGAPTPSGADARARSRRRHSTGIASRSPPTSAGWPTPNRAWRSGPRPSACCDRSSCSCSVRHLPPRKSSWRSTGHRARARARAAADHSHARRRRRQATAVPADAARGQSVSWRAGHPRAAESSRAAAHTAARDSRRVARRAASR